MRQLHIEWVGEASSLGLQMDSEMEKMGDMGNGEERDEDEGREYWFLFVFFFFLK